MLASFTAGIFDLLMIIFNSYLNCFLRAGSPLPPDLEDWLKKDGSKPVIYFSMGSIFDPPDDFFNMIQMVNNSFWNFFLSEMKKIKNIYF